MGCAFYPDFFKNFFDTMNWREELFLKEKEDFDREKEKGKDPIYHIMADIKDPALIAIDDMYVAADNLSIKNAKLHQYILFLLSLFGVAVSIAFFAYFEGEMHIMIFICLILLLYLIFIEKKSKELGCHRKYLEYRVLAETLRVQFFLSLSGMKEGVLELLPWFTKQGIPWIENIVKSLPIDDVNERKPIIYYWILNQKTYHEGALISAEKAYKAQINKKNRAIIITGIAFVIGLLFEIFMYVYSPNIDAHIIRLVLKAVIGIASVYTLFLESYYGKMSLYEKINDHKRMILLYSKIEKEIRNEGEKPAIILELARECLIENSAWYAYQSKNKPELVL